MKDIKRRLERFSFYNPEGISAHFTRMAQKGWMVDRFQNPFWVYRRIEPKNIAFAVSYFAKASEFDPEPTEEQLRFIDFCNHTGWELACTSAQMHVFFNEQENPTPIETEPALELEAIHASAKKSFLPAYFVLMLIGLLQGGLWLSSLLGDPIELLASPAKLVTGFFWFLLLLLTAVELTCYFRWHRKAVRAAEQGAFILPPNTAKFQKWIMTPALLMFIYWLVSWLICGDKLQRWIAVTMCIYMPVLFAVTIGVKTALKRRKASRGTNRALTLLTSFVCAFVIIGGITAGTLYASSKGFFKDEIKIADLPLTISDLLEVNEEDYITMNSPDKSLLLSRQKIEYRPDFDLENRSDYPRMDYTVVGVKLPVLYEFCKNRMIYEQETLYHIHQRGVDYEYRAEDTSAWNALEVYRLYDNAVGFFTNRYLLCYNDSLIELRLDWEPTVEQKAIIGEKFGGK